MSPPRRAVPAALLAVAVLLAACGSSDPQTRVLEQRARWDVLALGWVESPDGSINFSTRVSGPPNSKIDRLTIAIDLLDAGGNTIRRVWHTYDLEEMPRGGPKDVVIRIEPEGAVVEGVGLSRVLQPSAEEEPHIRELQSR